MQLKKIVTNLRFTSIIFLLCSGLEDISAETYIPEYSATITRDIYGVPHIHGSRDEDAAFGLAYAQAEDDITNAFDILQEHKIIKGNTPIGFTFGQSLIDKLK